MCQARPTTQDPKGPGVDFGGGGKWDTFGYNAYVYKTVLLCTFLVGEKAWFQPCKAMTKWWAGGTVRGRQGQGQMHRGTFQVSGVHLAERVEPFWEGEPRGRGQVLLKQWVLARGLGRVGTAGFREPGWRAGNRPRTSSRGRWGVSERCHMEAACRGGQAALFPREDYTPGPVGVLRKAAVPLSCRRGSKARKDSGVAPFLPVTLHLTLNSHPLPPTKSPAADCVCRLSQDIFLLKSFLY